jgi:hypothetical protein
MFPEIPEVIACLTDLEERLVSPRIAFLQLRALGPDRQLGIVGNVVNVPINNEEVLRCIPRTYDQSETVQLKFMRRLEYNKPFMYDKIRPQKVHEAAAYLNTKKLFKENKIEMNNLWFDQHKNATDFIVDNTDKYVDNNDSSAETLLPDLSLSFQDSEVDDLELEEEVRCLKNNTVRRINQPEYQDTLLNPENHFIPPDIIMAPGEGQNPIPLVRDKVSEALTFIKIYGGENMKYFKENSKITYQAICKSEFRRYDRRCANNINKIFYSYKKLVARKLINSINTCMKKTKRTDGLTAGMVLNADLMNEFLATGEAKLFLRTIRSSPSFWEWKKMEINAMIRQLGCPSFFMTFSPAEIDCVELTIIMYKIAHDKTITKEEASEISRDERLELVRKDPVTVARYFENRMIALLKYLKSPTGPYAENRIIEYFWRIDFQERGSPHLHMLTWNENAPKFFSKEEYANVQEEKENNRFLVNYIDKYITTFRPEDDIIREDPVWIENSNMRTPIYHESVNISFQIHKCRDSCLIEDNFGNKLCKKGFPKPILDNTLILGK